MYCRLLLLVVAGPQVLTTHCGKSIMCIGTSSNFFLPKMSIVYFFYTFVSNSFTVAKFRPAPARDGMHKRELADITSASSQIDKKLFAILFHDESSP